MKAHGSAILSLNGTWTYNYPDQHLANGRAKRLRTAYQFKKIVRISKRLRADMEERGIYIRKVPSFLVECLVYLAEDVDFTWIGDDRYDRVKRVLARALWRIENEAIVAIDPLTEINEVKALFEPGQAWAKADAIDFLRAALTHVGDV